MAEIDTIKSNISKMIAQGAPEGDIDAYLSAVGVTADQLRAAPASILPQIQMGAGDRALDVAKSGGVGLGEGAIGVAGIPGDIQELAKRGVEYLTGPTAPVQVPEGMQSIPPTRQVGQLPTSSDITQTVQQFTGPFYQPQTTEGQYARTIAQHAPGAALPISRAGPLARVMTQAVIPGAASETAGQLTRGTEYEPLARLGGSVAGGLAPTAVGRVLSPLPTSPQRQQAIAVLRKEGIEPTAGDVSGRKSLRYSESTVGDAPFSGGKASAQQEKVSEQFTSAILKRVGETATRATPDVIDGAFKRIGGVFENVGIGTTVKLDPQFGRDIKGVINEYNSLVAPSQQAPVVANYLKNFNDIAKSQGGVMDGVVYNAWRSELAALQRSASGDARLSGALSGMINSLDDAFERSQMVAGNKAAVDAIKEARKQYRNLLVVERAATGAGEDAASGLLSPRQMRQALTGQSRRDYSRGRGEFSELVHAANEALTPLPNSGTAQRAFATSIPLSILGGLGGGAVSGGTGAGIGAAAAATMGPGLLGRVLMNPLMQGYLKNQVATPALGGLNPAGNMSLQALMATPRELLLKPR